MYRLIQVRYACSVRRLRWRRRATSITLSRSFGSDMVTYYIGQCGLMIGFDTYLIVIPLRFLKHQPTGARPTAWVPRAARCLVARVACCLRAALSGAGQRRKRLARYILGRANKSLDAS